jgi:pyruvate dehydrogenase E2 component (dihydrolipoamide acetyltransferase)
VRVPDIGDFKDVAVIELLVKVGDTVKAEQSLITVESDKASMEILRAAGVVKELKVKLGDKVNQGSLVAILEGATSAAAPAPVAAAPASAPAVAAAAPAAVATAPVAGGARPRAHGRAQRQAAARLAEHAQVRARAGRAAGRGQGSGPKGRITQADVQGFVKGVMAGRCRPPPRRPPRRRRQGGGIPGLLPWPKVDFAKFGEIEPRPCRASRRSAAPTCPQLGDDPAVTYHDDADITDLEAFRVQLNKENEKSGGVKLTMLAFLIKACVGAAEVPRVQQLAGRRQPGLQEVLPHRLCGRHAQRPGGAGDQGRRQEERARDRRRMAELAKKARDGKLGPADMQGACFTISSLGGIGGTYFTPIVNAPEVAILGVNKSVMKPVWDGKAFQPRLMLPLSLTADHRVIDGALATRFNVYLAQLLADFRRIAL